MMVTHKNEGSICIDLTDELVFSMLVLTIWLPHKSLLQKFDANALRDNTDYTQRELFLKIRNFWAWADKFG